MRKSKKNRAEDKDVANVDEGMSVDARSPSAWSPSDAGHFNYAQTLPGANTSDLPMIDYSEDGKDAGMHVIVGSASSVQTGVSMELASVNTPGTPGSSDMVMGHSEEETDMVLATEPNEGVSPQTSITVVGSVSRMSMEIAKETDNGQAVSAVPVDSDDDVLEDMYRNALNGTAGSSDGEFIE